MSNEIPAYMDWLVHQQHHRDLLRLAERERLAKTRPTTRWEGMDLFHKMVAWIQNWLRNQEVQTLHQEQECMVCCPQTV